MKRGHSDNEIQPRVLVVVSKTGRLRDSAVMVPHCSVGADLSECRSAFLDQVERKKAGFRKQFPTAVVHEGIAASVEDFLWAYPEIAPLMRIQR